MRRILFSVLTAALLVAPGCCTHGDYRPLLRQTRENLVKDIGPKYKKYLDADKKRPADLKKNDYGVVTDTVAALDRVLEKKEEPK